ncbi:MAG: hypothetical protein NC489_08240 [Ruminococcus flavefaciens]|nr:hypothetical protein [Ruminococcus flavefaciens]
MSTKVIKIPQDVCDAVQRADIEQAARREILATCIERGTPTDSLSFQQYQSEFNEWFVKFMDEKLKVEKAYVAPLNNDAETAKSWTLNYHTQELTITF